MSNRCSWSRSHPSGPIAAVLAALTQLGARRDLQQAALLARLCVHLSHRLQQQRQRHPVWRVFEPRDVHDKHEISERVVASDGGEVPRAGLRQRSSRVGRDQHRLLILPFGCACACACVRACVCVRNRGQRRRASFPHNLSKALLAELRRVESVTRGTLALCQACQLGKCDSLLSDNVQVFAAVKHALIEPPPHALPYTFWIQQQRVEAHGQRALWTAGTEGEGREGKAVRARKRTYNTTLCEQCVRPYGRSGPYCPLHTHTYQATERGRPLRLIHLS